MEGVHTVGQSDQGVAMSPGSRGLPRLSECGECSHARAAEHGDASQPGGAIGDGPRAGEAVTETRRPRRPHASGQGSLRTDALVSRCDQVNAKKGTYLWLVVLKRLAGG